MKVAVFSGRKKYLCLLLLLPCLIWGASDELDLPSVTIEGKDELQKKDEFYFDDDLSKQWQIDEDFGFDVGLQDLEFESKDSTNKTPRVGFVDFWLGYGHKAQLKAVYHNLQNELLDFEVESKNYFYDSKWNSLSQSFLWRPSFGKSAIDFSASVLSAKANDLTTQALKGGFAWNLAISDSLLQSVNISFFAENIEQKLSGVSKEKTFSNFGFSPKGQIKDILLSADIFHYADGLNAEVRACKNLNKWSFYTLDFWAGMSREKFVPSVGFLGLYFLPNKVYFQFENSPTISKKTHFDFLGENYDQIADYDLSQEIAPLDFTLKSGYKRYFNVFSNLSYKMNHIFYQEVAGAKIYQAEEKDFLLSKSGVEASYAYRDYSVQVSCYRELVVNRAKNYIPYEPGLVARASLSHILFEAMKTQVDFVASQLIKDDSGDNLDNKFELNLEQTWDFSDALSFNFRLLNILDKKLEKLPAYPERGLQAYVGVKWYF